MKTAFVASLLLFALLFLTLMDTTLADPDDAAGAYNCEGGCKQRCARAGVQDRCLKYCGICCAKCNCVPSGTYGNKHQCPCYRDMVNSKGKPKCP